MDYVARVGILKQMKESQFSRVKDGSCCFHQIWEGHFPPLEEYRLERAWLHAFKRRIITRLLFLACSYALDGFMVRV
jgi:hypothetical protein